MAITFPLNPANGDTHIENGITFEYDSTSESWKKQISVGTITSIGGAMTSHIIPDTNAIYDIGSAEYKVRHLFLSDNSLWIGDDHKVSIEGGKQKQKKRIKGKTPKKIFDALIGAGKLFATEADLKIKFKTDIHDPEPVPTADPDHADFQPKVHQWLHFAIINGMAGTVNPENIFDGTDDFEDESPETGITANPGFPLVTTNGAVGDLWLNTTTGELYACTDATIDANIWANTGDGTGNIIPNDPPGNPTNTTIPDQGSDTSFDHTFTGGTDTDGTVTHYMVDEITGASGGNVVANPLTVAVPEVPVGVPHQFTVGTLPGASDISFRVRSKDNNGSYSSGVTVNFNGTVGGTLSGGNIVQGDVHTFSSSSTLTVSGADVTVDLMIVAGGGSGGTGGWDQSGGAGAGGMYYREQMTLTPGSYTVVIGGGGGSIYSAHTVGNNGSDSSFGNIYVDGGGAGAGSISANSPGDGGSGGGGNSTFGGSTIIGQPYMFGNPGNGSGAGGGAGETPINRAGGDGKEVTIRGVSEYFAGGGGAGVYGASDVVGGLGGGGRGGISNNTSNGGVNTGGGGGGATSGGMGAGGSGIVIVRRLP